MGERKFRQGSLETLTYTDAIKSFRQLKEGRGAVLASLAERSPRVRLTPASVSKVIPETYLLSHPVDIKDVWVDNFNNINKVGRFYDTIRDFYGRGLFPIESGDEWKEKKSMVAKPLQPRHMPELNQVVDKYISEMLIVVNPKDNREIVIKDLHSYLKILSFQAASNLFHGYEASREAASDVSEAMVKINQFLSLDATLGGVPYSIYRRYPKVAEKVHAAETTIKQYADNVVANYQPANSDVMDALLNANSNENEDIARKKVKDEVLTLIGAGSGTTAVAISWALYFVSLPENAHYQSGIREEIQSRIDVSSPKSLTSMVVKEALRIYPSTYISARNVTSDITLNNSLGELDIPKGSKLFVSPYIAQRNPDYWEEANKFKPERFQEKYADGSYVPFGLGKRRCIGEHYAMAVSSRVTASILNEYQLDIVTKPVPIFESTLRPSEDFTVLARRID